MSHKIFHRLISGFLVMAIAFAGFTPALAAPLPKVAVYAADIIDWTNEVVTKLTATGLYSQVDNLSPLGCGSDPTPTLATLQLYAAILVYSDCGFNDPNALGNVLADYADGGGHVVVSTFAFTSFNFEIAGRFASDGYLPLTQGSYTQGSQLFLVADLPSDPLLAGVGSFDGGSGSWHNNPVSLVAGATLVAHWTNGQPLVAYKGSVVALNFFPPSSDSRGDFWNSATDGVRLMTNALDAATNTAMEITIDIKPGSQTNPINPKSSGKIPVAILSTPDFDAPSEVDKTSLTFGRTGDEHSLAFCNKKGEDVNGDGLRDLVCHFKTKLTGFKFGDTEGILKGQTVGGVPIEGHDVVRVLHASYP